MIQIFIDGEEVVSNKEFTIHQEMLNTSSTILNNCYPKTWEATKDYVSNFYFPKDYSNCEIYNNSNLIFAGIVENSGEISLRPSDPKYCNLQILDYKTLLSEGETLDYVIPNGTIENMIDSVISKITSYGFVKGNVELLNANEQIGAYSTLDKTAYDVFQYVAEISNSKWFTRMIDKNTIAIDFYSPELMENANQIEYNEQYFNDNNIVDMSFSFETKDYRNKQVILSDEIFSSLDTTDTFIANTNQTQFITSANVGSIKSIKVNTTPQTIGTWKDKELGIYADFYFKKGTNMIESSKGQNDGAIIECTYTSLIVGRQVLSNDDEINRISTQIERKGVIARYETRNDVSTSKEMSKIADSYLKFKGKPDILLTITTKDVDLFNIGQQVYFNAPIEQLQDYYMIRAKDIQITKTGNDGTIFYTYELCSNFDSESSINFFDNQRRKLSGNLEEGQFINRNIDIENNANVIFENLVINEITIDDNNELNAPLNAPFME